MPLMTPKCHHRTGAHAAFFGAALAQRGQPGGFTGAPPGALPLDPFDDDSSSGTASSPRGSESGVRLAPHAPAGLGSVAGSVPGAGGAMAAPAGADAAAATAAALLAAPPLPAVLTEDDLDCLVRSAES